MLVVYRQDSPTEDAEGWKGTHSCNTCKPVVHLQEGRSSREGRGKSWPGCLPRRSKLTLFLAEPHETVLKGQFFNKEIMYCTVWITTLPCWNQYTLLNWIVLNSTSFSYSNIEYLFGLEKLLPWKRLWRLWPANAAAQNHWLLLMKTLYKVCHLVTINIQNIDLLYICRFISNIAVNSRQHSSYLRKAKIDEGVIR